MVFREVADENEIDIEGKVFRDLSIAIRAVPLLSGPLLTVIRAVPIVIRDVLTVIRAVPIVIRAVAIVSTASTTPGKSNQADKEREYPQPKQEKCAREIYQDFLRYDDSERTFHISEPLMVFPALGVIEL